MLTFNIELTDSFGFFCRVSNIRNWSVVIDQDRPRLFPTSRSLNDRVFGILSHPSFHIFHSSNSNHVQEKQPVLTRMDGDDDIVRHYQLSNYFVIGDG